MALRAEGLALPEQTVLACQPEGRIEAKLAAGFFDCDGAVVLGNVVDARRAAVTARSAACAAASTCSGARTFGVFHVPGP